MMSTVTPKSTGVLVGEVVSYKKGKCKIKFTDELSPGDGIEIWTSNGKHVGTGISKQILANSIHELTIEGAIDIKNKVFKSHDKKLIDATKKEMAANKRVTVYGKIEAIVGQKIKLHLSSKDIQYTAMGNVVEAAQNAALSEEDAISQLSKTGNTPFIIEYTQTDIGKSIFISKSELNQLRRDAIKGLETELIKHIKKPLKAPTAILSRKERLCSSHQKLSVQLSDINHLRLAANMGVSRVYIDYRQFDDAMISKDIEIFVTLPEISRNSVEAIPQSDLIDGYLASTYGQLYELQAIGKPIMLDHSFNIFNDWAIEAFDKVTLSQELNIHEIKALNTQNAELIVYGRQRVMCTHNCPVGIYEAKSKNGKYCSLRFNDGDYKLRDKMGMEFPIKTDCHNCIAFIYNSKILDTAPRFKDIKDTGAESFRLVFTDEDEDTVRKIIERYKAALEGEVLKSLGQDYTYGHFFRGVE